LIQFWFSGGEAVDNECRKSFVKELEEIVEKGSYVDELKQTPEVSHVMTKFYINYNVTNYIFL